MHGIMPLPYKLCKFCKLKSESGFSLIEVMIGMAILSIGILAAVAIQYQVVRGNANSNVTTQEMLLAQRILEQMKNSETPSNLSSSVILGVDLNGANPGPYNVTVTVEPRPFGTINNYLRLITVAVVKNGGFAGHPVTLRALTFGSGV